MRIAIVHGYFLHDSGSAIYARELSRELVRVGHEVTLVCQEQSPENFDFIDSVYDLDAANRGFIEVMGRPPAFAGRCRLVRPHLGGVLLTYVAGPFPGFDAVPFQEATSDQIQAYVDANSLALGSIFDRWPPDLVQANHLIMQPVAVSRALRGQAPYVVTLHGSELNFSLNSDSRLVPFAIEGMVAAGAIFALSDSSLEELKEFAVANRLDLAGRAIELPPGVDTQLFSPHNAAPLPSSIQPLVEGAGDVAVFAGRLLWTKGLHYAVAALPMILAERPGLHMLVAGEGPMRDPLEEFIRALDAGDFDRAARVAASEIQLQAGEGYGEVLPALNQVDRDIYLAGARGLAGHIHFLGHLDHDRLAGLFAAADISLAPSVFPEAFGLVSIEALAAGAVPVATYQSGLRTPLNATASLLADDTLRNLRPGVSLTTALAGEVLHVLASYPTHDVSFRERLHGLAEERFSWSVVAHTMLDYANKL